MWNLDPKNKMNGTAVKQRNLLEVGTSRSWEGQRKRVKEYFIHRHENRVIKSVKIVLKGGGK
jgi:hypothetical protein